MQVVPTIVKAVIMAQTTVPAIFDIFASDDFDFQRYVDLYESRKSITEGSDEFIELFDSTDLSAVDILDFDNPNIWVPPAQVIEQFGSVNELSNKFDTMFDGNGIYYYREGFQWDYEPDDFLTDRYIAIKPIMQSASKALSTWLGGKSPETIMQWSDIREVFNEPFIRVWRAGTKRVWSGSPDNFNLGVDEQQCILDWANAR